MPTQYLLTNDQAVFAPGLIDMDYHEIKSIED